jgi:hypothetical protein
MTNSAWNANNLAEKTFLHHIDEVYINEAYIYISMRYIYQ